MNSERQTAIEGLVRLGLSLGEAKTYVALLELAASEATPLAKAARVPQPKIYGYLSNLETKGIAMKAEISGKPNVYRPAAYETVINQLKEESDKKFNETARVLELIRKEQDPTDIGEYISLTQGERAVENGLNEAIRKIRKNAIILNSSPHNDIIDQLLSQRSEVEVIRPIIDIMNNIDDYPRFIKLISTSPQLKILAQNRPLIMFRDVNYKDMTCEAVVIVGYPYDPSDLRQEPLIVEITHRVITKFQVNLVMIIVELLKNLTKITP